MFIILTARPLTKPEHTNLIVFLLMSTILDFLQSVKIKNILLYNLARTPEIGQGLLRILSCGARKQEQI